MSNLAELLKNRGQNLAGLARELGVNKATVWRWNAKGVPHTRLADVEAKTGIPACDIRPDIAHVFLKTRAGAQ